MKTSIRTSRILIPVIASVVMVVVLLYNAKIGTSNAESNEYYAIENGLNWMGFNDGLALAKKENKPMLVDVFAVWCQPCKLMDEQIFANEEIIAYMNKNFVAIKVDGESEEKIKYKNQDYTKSEWALSMNVRAYPTTIFFGPDGIHITRLEGALLDVPKFLDVLEYVKQHPSYKLIQKAEDFDSWRKKKGGGS